MKPSGLLNLNHAIDASRWYPLKPHPKQLELVNDEHVRFKVVPAGRRSGKTERAKRYIVRKALQKPRSYFVAAPTRDQVKRIYWNDLKQLSFMGQMPLKVSESDLILGYPNGASISLIGLDQPQRMEGVIWGGGIIDEIADTKPEAWPENIRPALDTEDPRYPGEVAWCWLIGVPEGLNHYYDISEYARTSGDPEWKNYHWLSADILSPEKIAAAKRSMSKRQFKQEYEASFETAGGRIYEDYSSKNHTDELIRGEEELIWGHDFNFTPMSSFIGVRRGDNLFALSEIVMDSAVARQAAQEFVDRFAGHANKKVIIYGDPAGRAGEKHGHASDYNEIEQVLRENRWTYERRVRMAAPAIRDRQNAVRAKICTADDRVTLFVNPKTVPTLHKGLSTVQAKKGSTFIEEVSREQHITTAIGYCVAYEWPVLFHEEKVVVIPQPIVHRWNK